MNTDNLEVLGQSSRPISTVDEMYGFPVFQDTDPTYPALIASLQQGIEEGVFDAFFDQLNTSSYGTLHNTLYRYSTLIALSTANNDVNGNRESALGLKPSNTVGLIPFYDSALSSPNSSVHTNSVGHSGTEGQNVNGFPLGGGENAFAFLEWYDLGDEDGYGSGSFHTPAAGSPGMFC